MSDRATTQRKASQATVDAGGRGKGAGDGDAVQMAAIPGVGVTSLEALQMAGGNQAMVQLAGDGGADAVHAAAARGVEGGGGAMPHAEKIQSAFGRHDVSAVQAHVGGAATEATAAMGASAYASGNNVAFGSSPDLHTAAHEAAHVVQQRAGVQLKGGVGEVGDSYEKHADAVADAVVAGKSAEGLLDQRAPGARESSPVQQKADDAVGHEAVQRKAAPGAAVQMAMPSKSDATKLQSGCVKKKGKKLGDGERAGGFNFGNNEGKLPAADSSGAPVTYTEYDVNAKKPGADRDAERIVVGSDGKVWYTDDHYGSFTEVK